MNRLNKQFVLRSVDLFLLVISTAMISCAITVSVLYILNSSIARTALELDKFPTIFGIMFAMVAVIAALSGLANAHNMSEPLIRLRELENAVNKHYFHSLPSIVTILLLNVTISHIRNSGGVKWLIVHCYSIASAIDLSHTDEDGIYEIEVSVCEIYKLVGLKSLLAISELLKCNPVCAGRYSTCSGRIKKMCRSIPKHA